MSTLNDPEEWRVVPSLPQYEASSHGRVRRISFAGPMPKGGSRMYGGMPWSGSWDPVARRFVLQFKGKTYRVARMICEAFHGPSPFLGAVAMHIDEDSTHNWSGNLEWGTQKQNLNAPGYLEFRRNSPGRRDSKSNPLQRADIARRGMAGERVTDLAREFGLSQAYVSTIVSKARALAS